MAKGRARATRNDQPPWLWDSSRASSAFSWSAKDSCCLASSRKARGAGGREGGRAEGDGSDGVHEGSWGMMGQGVAFPRWR
jgi:hypothetical protein